jgi:hypothetical protein
VLCHTRRAAADHANPLLVSTDPTMVLDVLARALCALSWLNIDPTDPGTQRRDHLPVHVLMLLRLVTLLEGDGAA